MPSVLLFNLLPCTGYLTGTCSQDADFVLLFSMELDRHLFLVPIKFYPKIKVLH